jgi:prepilin-type N-terminal cleavage/methylation domain-containing protein
MVRVERACERQRGFTLVELLVVVAIIGILIALLLPAVQAARESARRIECSNHLKQIGLAMVNYHDVRKVFPYATPWDQVGANDTGGTWAAMILPYMEQEALYKQFDFTKLMTDPANAAAVKTVVKAYLCPSDPRSSEPIFDDRQNLSASNPKPSLGSWYVVSIGPTKPDLCVYCPGVEPNYCCQGNNYGSTGPAGNSVGMFGRYPKCYSARDITDGLSRTLMVGETLPGQCVYSCAHCPNFPLASTSIPLNTFEIVSIAGGAHYRACGFKSDHPGGAYFALADGTVHFFNDSVDFQVYNELGTRAGHEVVQLP